MGKYQILNAFHRKEKLFTKIDKEDFLRVAELRKPISNDSRNELKVWKFSFIKKKKKKLSTVNQMH